MNFDNDTETEIEKLSEQLLGICVGQTTIENIPSNDIVDQIHDLILLLMKYNRYQTIDILLKMINPRKITLYELLSILTATSWCKDKLKNRDGFFKRAKFRLDVWYKQGILDGLK